MNSNYSFNITGNITFYAQYNEHTSQDYQNVLGMVFNEAFDKSSTINLKIPNFSETDNGYFTSWSASSGGLVNTTRASSGQPKTNPIDAQSFQTLSQLNNFVLSAYTQLYSKDDPRIVSFSKSINNIFYVQPILTKDLIEVSWNMNGRQNLFDIILTKQWYDSLENSGIQIHVGAYVELYQNGSIFFKGIIHSYNLTYSMESGTPEFVVRISCEGLDGVLSRTKIYYSYICSKLNIGGSAFLSYLGLANDIKAVPVTDLFRRIIFYGLTSNQFVYKIPSNNTISNISSQFLVNTHNVNTSNQDIDSKYNDDFYFFDTIQGTEDVNMSIMDYINSYLILPDYEMFIYPDGTVNYNKKLEFIDNIPSLKDYEIQQKGSNLILSNTLPLSLVNYTQDTYYVYGASPSYNQGIGLYNVYNIQQSEIINLQAGADLADNITILNPNILSMGNDFSYQLFAEDKNNINLYSSMLGTLNSMRGGLVISDLSWSTAWKEYKLLSQNSTNASSVGCLPPNNGDQLKGIAAYAYQKSRIMQLYDFSDFDMMVGSISIKMQDIHEVYPGHFIQFADPFSKSNTPIIYRIMNSSGVISLTNMTSIATLNIAQASLPNQRYLDLLKTPSNFGAG